MSFPASTAYTNSLGSYWSQQEEAVTPGCVFSPTSAEDVSKAMPSCQVFQPLAQTSALAANLQSGVAVIHHGQALPIFKQALRLI